jgi:adenylate cyclase
VSGETILVVDDGKENREFVVEYVLKPNGFEHLTARDGQEGLEMALANRPDLILLDLQMPRLDGIGVLRKLDANHLDIPVILMTFHGSEEIAVEVHRLGVKDYVKKPYTPDEMLDAIERSLSEIRLRREKEALTERVIHANRELQRRLQELNILYNVGKSVTATTDLRVLLPRIVDAAIQITGAEEGYIYLLENKQLLCRAQKRRELAAAEYSDYEIRDPIALHVLKKGSPIALGEEQLQSGEKDSPTSVAYAPLIHERRPVGVIGVANFSDQSRTFANDDSNLLSALGDYAAISIVNSQNMAAIRESREQVKDTFERFVPPSVVQRAIAKPDNVTLGGARQEISVLFADIRGYTAWSENAEPEQVVEVLNHYLSLAAGVILGWEGTLDKFFGDGLMAIFNAPDRQNDHVHRAADAAIALMQAASEVNEIYGHRLTYSVGVNVGEAVVGYIGTERALNYTAIGDTVNLAKRLQESSAPGQIIVEEAVVKRLGNQAKVRRLGDLRVKGRKTPAFAYELIDVES